MDKHDSGSRTSETHADPEVDGDLIVGDFDAEEATIEHPAAPHTKPKLNLASTIREDIDYVVKGTLLCI